MQIQNRKEVEKRLEYLHEKYGTAFGPEVVLQDACSEDSVLHSLFEWDNNKAAHQHRLEQARVLLRSVRVTVEVREIQVRVPKYIRNPDVPTHTQGYVRTLDLRGDTNRAVSAILIEMDRLEALLTRVRNIAEGLGLDNFIATLSEVAEKIRKEVS